MIAEKGSKVSSAVLFCLLLIMAALCIVPLAMMILGSFKTQPEALQFNLALPQEWQFENYSYVVENGKIFNGYKNSLLVTVPATTLAILFGSMAGVTLSRRNSRLSGGLYYYFIFGLALTLQIASLFALLKTLNIYGSFFAVISIFVALRLPFTVMSFASFVKGVPRDIDEAATIDGCGYFTMFFRVMLPVLKPVLVTNIIISAIDIWNNFMIPLFYFGSAKNWTVSLAIYNFFGRYMRDWQYVFSALTLAILPMLILFLLLQKQIIGGMVAGSVKG